MTTLLELKRKNNNVANLKKISTRTELTRGKREACLLSKGPGRQGGSAKGINKQIQKGNLSFRGTVRI